MTTRRSFFKATLGSLATLAGLGAAKAKADAVRQFDPLKGATLSGDEVRGIIEHQFPGEPLRFSRDSAPDPEMAAQIREHMERTREWMKREWMNADASREWFQRVALNDGKWIVR